MAGAKQQPKTEVTGSVGTSKKLLKMCERCKNTKCKENNYSMLHHCSGVFHWIVFGITVGALAVLLSGAYLIIRIIDGNWCDWRLPTVMAIGFFVYISVASMFFALPTIKREMGPQEDNLT